MTPQRESITEKAGYSGRRLIAEDRFALVLALIIATILASAFLDDGPVALVSTLGLVCLTIVVTVSTSNASRFVQRVTGLVVVIAFLGVAAAQFLDYFALARLGFYSAMVTLTLVCPVVIVQQLARQSAVRLNTVAGAADIFLLIGLLFAVVYGFIGSFQAGHFHSLAATGVPDMTPSQAFFSASRPTDGSDFVYYSFATLTTVGYGDLTATTSLGRILSTTEALIGQLYLVTVVAVLVSNLGRVKRHPAATSSDEPEGTGTP
jgi:hypothetical protein